MRVIFFFEIIFLRCIYNFETVQRSIEEPTRSRSAATQNLHKELERVVKPPSREQIKECIRNPFDNFIGKSAELTQFVQQLGTHLP